MADESKTHPDHPPLLEEVLTKILREKDAGREPNLADWKALYPEFTEQLTDFFADQKGAEEVFAAFGRDDLGSVSGISPARGNTVEASASGPLGTCGDYELLAVIGRGGMGVVYKARQRDLDRVVALKKIRSTRQPSQEEVFRFLEEAKAAARLQHDNIVRVYEYGREGPENYYTMELIDGETLADRRTQYNRNSGAVVQLMSKIALAVQHAHSRGVLHRDLKPSNILLDNEKGMPHVADFGLAGILDDSGRLAEPSGGAVGTLRYMAPEQALDPDSVTVAAGIFSIGVILYEFLTGQHPLLEASQSAGEPTAQGLHTWRPRPPRQLNSKLSRDLEAVCLKCLERNPDLRYPTARDLADDLARTEKGLPVTARPLALGERAVRGARRHMAVVAPLALLLALVGAGVGFYFYNLYRERDHALERSRQESENRERTANMLAVMQAVIKEERGGGVAELEQLSRNMPTDPDLRLKFAQTWNAAGDLYRQRRQYERAMKAHGQAQKLFHQLEQEHPDQPVYRAERAAALQNLALTYDQAGKAPEARQHYTLATEILESLVHDYPDYAAGPRYLRHTLGNLAVYCQRRNRLDEALIRYKRLEQLLEALPKRESRDTQRLATVKNNLADIYRQKKMKDETRKLLVEALKLRRGLAADAPNNIQFQFELATSLSNMGLWPLKYPSEEKGRHRAKMLLGEAIDIDRALSSHFPSIPDYEMALRRDQHYLAMLSLQCDPSNGDCHSAYLAAVEARVACFAKYGLLAAAKQDFQEVKDDWEAWSKVNPTINLLSRLPAEIDDIVGKKP